MSVSWSISRFNDDHLFGLLGATSVVLRSCLNKSKHYKDVDYIRRNTFFCFTLAEALGPRVQGPLSSRPLMTKIVTKIVTNIVTKIS